MVGTAKLEIAQAGNDANVQLAYLGAKASDDLRQRILSLASGARDEPEEATARRQYSSDGVVSDRVYEFLSPELDPDAVHATGGVVGAGSELAAGVQLGEHHLDTGQLVPWLDVHRDAPALVRHGDAAVPQQRDLDLTTEAAEGLVHRVVDDLPQAVHETARVG